MSAPLLAFRTLGPDDAPHTVWFLHGILGSGNNWRSFARRLLDDHPDWRAVLIDLRNHGDSQGLPGPHTLAACAEDLWALSAELGHTPQVVVGHSFGGKVALTFARSAAVLGQAGPGALQQLWVLDAFPSAWPHDPDDDPEVVSVIGALAAIPLPLDRREQVVGILTGQGFSADLAHWMTTNLRRDADGYVWRFDLDAAREMIADYFAQDLWDVVEDPADGLRVDVVRAERSDRWSDAELARFAALPDDGPSRLHLLADSGHWVHVDQPDALRHLIGPSLADRR
ncbi:MAG: alpha/beta hydrolase [Alphaproteobacteria bacterium]|nr:alpha/beta hydrolase [Alphaproteobacteria bacterium]